MNNFIKSNVVTLGIAIIGISVTWGTFTTRLNADEQNISSLQSQISDMQKDITEIKIDTAVIKTGVEDLQKQLK